MFEPTWLDMFWHGLHDRFTDCPARVTVRPDTRSRSRRSRASRSSACPCRRGPRAPCSARARRSRTRSCWARRRSSLWRWRACRWRARRSDPPRPGQCPRSRNARGQNLKKQIKGLFYWNKTFVSVDNFVLSALAAGWRWKNSKYITQMGAYFFNYLPNCL